MCGPPSLVGTHEVVICGVDSDTEKPALLKKRLLVQFLEKQGRGKQRGYQEAGAGARGARARVPAGVPAGQAGQGG